REVQRQRGFTPELCWARSEQACEEASAVRESEEERREQDHDEPLLAVRWKEREADDQGRGSRKRAALPGPCGLVFGAKREAQEHARGKCAGDPGEGRAAECAKNERIDREGQHRAVHEGCGRRSVREQPREDRERKVRGPLGTERPCDLIPG